MGIITVSKVSNLEKKTVPIVFNYVIVHVEPGTGDERLYRAVKRKTYEDISLKASNTKLSTLQNGLNVLLKAAVRNQTRGTETAFVVEKEI